MEKNKTTCQGHENSTFIWLVAQCKETEFFEPNIGITSDTQTMITQQKEKLDSHNGHMDDIYMFLECLSQQNTQMGRHYDITFISWEKKEMWQNK